MRRGRRIHDLPRRSKIIASEQGISVLRDGSSEPVTVRFDETAAVLELGPGRLSLIGVNGDWVEVDTNVLLRGSKLEEELRQRVPRELFVPFQAPGGSVLDLSREKIGYRTRVAKEIGVLPSRLEPGEKVLTLAVAMYRRRRGLLALTDRRLLHLSKAATKKPRLVEVELSEVSGVRSGRLESFGRKLAVRTSSGKTHRFSEIRPTERATEFEQALASPKQPHFTAQALDTTLRGRLADYAVGLAFLLVGLLLLATQTWSGAFFGLAVSSGILIRTYLRRRERDRHGRGSS